MKQKILLKSALSTATCALLGQAAFAEESASTDKWKIDGALLAYVESGRRTEVFGPVILANKLYDDGDELRLKFAVDVITGASPTGATPSSRVQTFTRPSGRGGYTISPGEIPVDDTFMDTRVSVSVDREQLLNRYDRLILGGAYSYEYDFISYGLRSTYAHDLQGRNTTLSIGVAVEKNALDPEGGVPIELATSMIARGLPQNKRGSKESRQQADLLLGWTQVLSRRTIMQFNLGLGYSSGYHSDPFKVVSVIEANSLSDLGEPVDNVFESRPDRREKNTLFWKLNHHFNTEIINLSYRWLRDDWGVRSHTLDINYTFFPKQAEGQRWQPSIRLYRQHAADFYRTNLLNTQLLPNYVSADYRLGDMDGLTLGIKHIRQRKNGKPFEVRIDYIMQDNTASKGSKLGYLENVKIVDDTTAVMVRLNYVL